jgi:metallo-beta-lactamase class B
MDRTFRVVRDIPCDVPLGDHGSEYRMQAKYARLKAGGPNPFIDKEGCFLEADIQEAMYKAVMAEQAAAKP